MQCICSEVDSIGSLQLEVVGSKKENKHTQCRLNLTKEDLPELVL
jgi:hypothetical protein